MKRKREYTNIVYACWKKSNEWE